MHRMKEGQFSPTVQSGVPTCSNQQGDRTSPHKKDSEVNKPNSVDVSLRPHDQVLQTPATLGLESSAGKGAVRGTEVVSLVVRFYVGWVGDPKNPPLIWEKTKGLRHPCPSHHLWAGLTTTNLMLDSHRIGKHPTLLSPNTKGCRLCGAPAVLIQSSFEKWIKTSPYGAWRLDAIDDPLQTID